MYRIIHTAFDNKTAADLYNTKKKIIKNKKTLLNTIFVNLIYTV